MKKALLAVLVSTFVTVSFAQGQTTNAVNKETAKKADQEKTASTPAKPEAKLEAAKEAAKPMAANGKAKGKDAKDAKAAKPAVAAPATSNAPSTP